MHRFGVALGELVLPPSVSEIAARRVDYSAGRVGLRAHCFRFSACTASGLPSAGWPSGSPLPLFGTHRFGVAVRRAGSSAFRFGDCRSASWPLGGWPSGLLLRRLPFGGLAFGLTASAFRYAPLQSCHWASSFFRLPLRKLPSAGWSSGSPLPLFGTHRFGDCPRRVGLRAHCFRFSARAVSELPFGELAFGLTASAFRHAPIRSCCWEGWPSDSLLPLFGTHRFGVAARRLAFGLIASEIAIWRVGASAFRFGVALGGLAFGLTTSAFRHAPIRSGHWAGWPSDSLLPLFGTHRFGVAARRLAFGLTASAFRHAPLRRLPSAGWPSGSPLPLFGTHRSAPPHRRREGRRSTPTRHLFHFKTLIPTC